MQTYLIVILAIALFVSIGTFFVWILEQYNLNYSSNKLFNQISLLATGFITYQVYGSNSLALCMLILCICVAWLVIFFLVINKRG